MEIKKLYWLLFWKNVSSRKRILTVKHKLMQCLPNPKHDFLLRIGDIAKTMFLVNKSRFLCVLCLSLFSKNKPNKKAILPICHVCESSHVLHRQCVCGHVRVQSNTFHYTASFFVCNFLFFFLIWYMQFSALTPL